MNIHANFPKNLVKEVAVFEAPGIKKWVIRCFGFGQIGDITSDTKPTEEELKAEFGESLKILWRYEIVSSEALGLISESLKGWQPNFNVLIPALLKNNQNG